MSEKLNHPVCLIDLKLSLGEGPLWNAGEKALYFVDIEGRKLYRYQQEIQSGQAILTLWETDHQPAFILPVSDGSFLVGQTDGLYHFSSETGLLNILCKAGNERVRLNDGCVDRKGRLWFGTMDLQEKEGRGALFCLTFSESGYDLKQVDEDYIVSNGPAVSPDGRRLYVADSPRQCIYVFDLDEAGQLTHKRVFARLEQGYPDGLAVDSQGVIWCGVWGGSRIVRFQPDGKILPPIFLPVSNVTKICFGGPDLRTVYVTTARNGLNESVLSREPQAGGVFTFKTDVPGWASPCFPALKDTG